MVQADYDIKMSEIGSFRKGNITALFSEHVSRRKQLKEEKDKGIQANQDDILIL